jgi:hypothetical protein
MRRTASLAFFLLALASGAHADWAFSNDKSELMLESLGSAWAAGAVFLSFSCREGGPLTSDYASLDMDETPPLPPEANVRLEIAVTGGKRASFLVVLDAEDGSAYGMGDRDARRVLALVGEGAPFVANLRLGKQVAWNESFDAKGCSDLKAEVAAFCPAAPQEE